MKYRWFNDSNVINKEYGVFYTVMLLIDCCLRDLMYTMNFHQHFGYTCVDFLEHGYFFTENVGGIGVIGAVPCFEFNYVPP